MRRTVFKPVPSNASAFALYLTGCSKGGDLHSHLDRTATSASAADDGTGFLGPARLQRVRTKQSTGSFSFLSIA